MKKKTAYTICADFCRKFEKSADVLEVLIEYRKLMKQVLKLEFRIPRRAANEIIDSLGTGNWEHLWETDAEKQAKTNALICDLIDEIFYCSDRWTWDRFLRTNWIYLRLKSRVNHGN